MLDIVLARIHKNLQFEIIIMRIGAVFLMTLSLKKEWLTREFFTPCLLNQKHSNRLMYLCPSDFRDHLRILEFKEIAKITIQSYIQNQIQ